MTNKLQLLPNNSDKTVRLGGSAERPITNDFADQTYIVAINKADQAQEFMRVTGTGSADYRIDISPGYDGILGEDDTPDPDFIWYEKKAITNVATGANTGAAATSINEVWARWIRVQIKLNTLAPVVDFFLTGLDKGN